MPKLQIESVGTFEVPANKRLVNALTDECGQDQLHSCGGMARCTTCRVEIIDGQTSPMTELERSKLIEKGLIDQTSLRLSCQMNMIGDLSIRIISRFAGSGKKDSGARPADVIGGSPAPARKINSDWVQVDPNCRRRTIALGESIT